MTRPAFAALWTLLAAGCGPSASNDEPCTREDVITSGALVVGSEPQECSSCDLEASYVLITLETTCEAGVEWVGPYRIIHHTTAVNLATGEEHVFENPLSEPAERSWRVAPGEPVTWPGDDVSSLVDQPGDYAFRVELLQELMAVEFVGSVE